MRKTPESPSFTAEPGAGAGFSDWQKVAKGMGHRTLATLIKKMDSGNTPAGMNEHRAIARQLEVLGLPVQNYIHPSVGDFVNAPHEHLSQLLGGDYYFVSIRPGIHLAHGDSSVQVIDFINDFAAREPNPESLDREVYISHNGEPIMSGHILVGSDDAPNTIFSEFTVGNFNAFHRGVHSPEITVSKTSHRFEWNFGGRLKPTQDDDWRSTQAFTCNGDVAMTRPEMARRIFGALSHLPHDGDYYLPGYYEVLLQRTVGDCTRPVFIEALPGVAP